MINLTQFSKTATVPQFGHTPLVPKLPPSTPPDPQSLTTGSVNPRTGGTVMAPPIGVKDPVSLDSQFQMRDMKNVAEMGLAALGVGAGLRGVSALGNLLSRAVSPPKPKYPTSLVTKIPIPVRDEEKQASIFHPGNESWGYPAALLATGMGAIGGWKGVDSLLQTQQQAAKNKEQEDAKKDFETALMSNYARPRSLALKTAGDELGELLDTLYDQVQSSQIKQADILGSAMGGGMNLAGSIVKAIPAPLKGMYGMYALGTGLPAAYWAYQGAQKGSNRAVLDKAMKRRTHADYMSQPSEIYAEPQGVAVDDTDKLASSSFLSQFAQAHG